MKLPNLYNPRYICNMKRQALIIGSSYPKDHQKHLSGVSEDILNYQKLLLSANGGAWLEKEIIILRDPSLDDILNSLRYQNGADYALTIFTGHGFIDNRENLLCVNHRQSLNYKGLYSNAKRHVIIMDACRVDYSYGPTPGLFGLDIEFEHENPITARKIFDAAVARTPHGILAVFSTAANKESQDTEDGGAFTVELMSQTIEWLNTRKGSCFSMGRAFLNTREGLRRYEFPQAPQLQFSNKLLCAIPLAINAMDGKRVHRINDTLSKNQSKPKGMTVNYIA